MKIYTNELGHMTNMAAMPIYGKNLKKSSSPEPRALTPLFGNGAGAFRIGKNSVVLTKIGKIYKVLCIEEFIVRLI